MPRKKNILFVGAFNKRNTKNLIGGQLFACKSLAESNLSTKYNFIKLCTSQRSIPPPNILIRVYDSIIRFLRLFKILIFNKIDVGLIFTTAGFGFLEKGIMIFICKKFNVKTILFPRSGHILKDVKKTYFQNFLKNVIRNTNVLIVQGKSWSYFYEKYNNHNSTIKIQQNWINHKKYQNIERKFDKKGLNILFLGWIVEEKGIFDLVSVFKNIIQKKERPIITLLVAGMGKDYDLLKRKVQEFKLTNNVNLLGWVNENEKLELLKKTDIYVCPSKYEGFPNSLLECMASGIPTISSNVGSIPDIISHGYNGFLYDYKDNNTLESLIIKLIHDSDLREKFSINSKNYINSNNTIEVACNMIKDTISKI